MSRNGQFGPEETTFVNNFWGSKDAGFHIIQTKIKHSTNSLQELLDYYSERINVEKEYNRKLDKLNNKVYLGSNETGTLKQSLDKLHYENDQMCKYNDKFIKSVSQNNYDKLQHFYQVYCKEVGKIEHHMSKVLNKRSDALKNFEMLKTKYQEECSQMKSCALACQTTWGKELEKYEHKLQKLQDNSEASMLSYKAASDRYKEYNEIWIRDWSISLQNFYQLEIERIQLCKINCFNFCNNIATLCVDIDQSVDLARTSFAQVSPPQDMQDFSNNYGTGNQIVQPSQFVDFMDGYDDSMSHKSMYNIANFETPDYSKVLARTYSTHSNISQQQQYSQSSSPKSPQQQQQLQIPPTPTVTKPSPPSLAPPASASDTPASNATSLQVADHLQASPMSPAPSNFSPLQHHPTTPRSAHPLQTPPFGGNVLQTNKVDLPPPQPTGYTNNHLHRKTNSNLHLTSPSQIRRRPTNGSQFSGFEDDNRTDVFSVKDMQKQFNSSNGSSNYSNPTNYSNSTSSGDRNWASPRRKEKQLHQFQEQINLKSKEGGPAHKNMNVLEPPEAPAVPITKDFSIDFIAKALEDLNSGGDGDINKYRKSVRRAEREKEERQRDEEYRQRNSIPASPFRPASDYIDDSTEVATRYDSISFSSPAHLNSSPKTTKSSMLSPIAAATPTRVTPTRSGPKRIRPKSMLEPMSNDGMYRDDSIGTTIVNKSQTALMSPKKRPSSLSSFRTSSKSYTNLHSMLNQESADKTTPVTGHRYLTKAKARYTFKPQNHNELYFKKGWQMYIIHKQEDNWFAVELGKNCNDRAGMFGLVPGNYLIEGDDLF